MKILKKTSVGTIGAYQFSDGISFGCFADGSVKAIGTLEEYNGKLRLALFDKKLKELGIEVTHE